MLPTEDLEIGTLHPWSSELYFQRDTRDACPSTLLRNGFSTEPGASLAAATALRMFWVSLEARINPPARWYLLHGSDRRFRPPGRTTSAADFTSLPIGRVGESCTPRTATT